MAQRRRGAAAGPWPDARQAARPADRSSRMVDRGSGQGAAADVVAGGGQGVRRGGGGSGRPSAGWDMAATRHRLRAVAEQAVTSVGLDLEEFAVTRVGRRFLVRVTVDGDRQVGHDELTQVSHDLSARLDAAEARDGAVVPGAYVLEVSSPGVDRPLTLPRHWRRNRGRLVSVKVGQRLLTGRVASVDDSGVTLETGDGPVDVAFADLGPGRIQVELTRLDEAADGEDVGDTPGFDEEQNSRGRYREDEQGGYGAYGGRGEYDDGARPQEGEDEA